MLPFDQNKLKKIWIPSQTKQWSQRKPNGYGWRNKQNDRKFIKNRGILKPSWAFVETKSFRNLYLN